MKITYALAGINEAVKEFWAIARDFPVIALNGNLGAGKTTFMHALGAHLGIRETVSSPTFSIINEYTFPQTGGADVTVYHSDWYRLTGEEEAIQAGVEDMLQQDNAYCFVEWAERAPGLLPRRMLYVDFEYIDEDKRTLILRPVQP